MAHGIGVVITERITVAAVRDNQIDGELRIDPEESSADSLLGVPADLIIQRIVELVRQLDLKEPPTHIGIGMPGIIRDGNVEDSPNLVQFKGVRMGELVSAAFEPLFGRVPVGIFNDADVMAAGIAATAGASGPPDSSLDARDGNRIWPLSVCQRRLGSRAHSGHA